MDQNILVACDTIERDLIDMMWSGFDFTKIIEINKDKYLKFYGKLPNVFLKLLMDAI